MRVMDDSSVHRRAKGLKGRHVAASAERAILSIVLLPVNARAHAVGVTLEPDSLRGRDRAVRCRCALVTVEPQLAAHESPRFRPRQLAGSHALRDACALLALACVEPRRIGKRGY
jgi:hypothetical protein